MLESINLFGIYYKSEHPMHLLKGRGGKQFHLEPKGYDDYKLSWPHCSKCDQSAFTSSKLCCLYLPNQTLFSIFNSKIQWSEISLSFFCLRSLRIIFFNLLGIGQFCGISDLEISDRNKWGRWRGVILGCCWYDVVYCDLESAAMVCRVCYGIWDDNSYSLKPVIWRLKEDGW